MKTGVAGTSPRLPSQAFPDTIASTSARLGAAVLPPKRLHLRAAAAAAKRRASTSARPSISASVKAP